MQIREKQAVSAIPHCQMIKKMHRNVRKLKAQLIYKHNPIYC